LAVGGSGVFSTVTVTVAESDVVPSVIV